MTVGAVGRQVKHLGLGDTKIDMRGHDGSTTAISAVGRHRTSSGVGRGGVSKARPKAGIGL